jgi:3-mercaptopyruvate sulfurtransferase SseA
MNNLRKTILALIAVSLTIGYIWYDNRSVIPKRADWDDVRTEAAKGDYRLITTDELWQQYNSQRESLLVVDTRQEWEYRSGHIQGAVNFPMEPTWLSRWRKRGALETVLGPDKNRLIVFY